MEERRRVLNEWLAWREREEEELSAERRELGLPEVDGEGGEKEDGAEGAVVEEIVEEVLDEVEEVM